MTSSRPSSATWPRSSSWFSTLRGVLVWHVGDACGATAPRVGLGCLVVGSVAAVAAGRED